MASALTIHSNLQPGTRVNCKTPVTIVISGEIEDLLWPFKQQQDRVMPFPGGQEKIRIMISLLVKVAHFCPTLCDPMDWTVREILQVRILEWVAFPFSRDLPKPGLPHCR